MPAVVSCPIPVALGQCVEEPAGLLEFFAQVPDPRDRRGRRYPLPVILALATCAMAAGHTGLDAMAEWAADAPQELLARLGSRGDGLRSRYTGPDERAVRRVLERLDPAMLDLALCAFAAAHTPDPARPEPEGAAALRAIAVDGRHLNGSGAAGLTPLVLPTALDHATGVILAQRQIGAKTNEIPEARTPLAGLDIAGCVITTDALHTQRDTAGHLLEHQAHYVFTVKANQPGLLEACHRRITVDGHATGEHHESERTRGKLRERHLTTANGDGIEFPAVQQIARIVRYTRQADTGRRPSGMDDEVMADLSADLDEFVRDAFRYLIYQGQREWAQVYLRGLMLPGLKRKSVQPMAAAPGVSEQNLGHFVGVAAWDWREVTARLAMRAVKVLAPTAWVLDEHPFLRAGRRIACAKKQYAGNGPPRLCQIAVSWYALSPRGSTPLYSAGNVRRVGFGAGSGPAADGGMRDGEDDMGVGLLVDQYLP